MTVLWGTCLQLSICMQTLVGVDLQTSNSAIKMISSHLFKSHETLLHFMFGIFFCQVILVFKTILCNLCLNVSKSTVKTWLKMHTKQKILYMKQLFTPFYFLYFSTWLILPAQKKPCDVLSKSGPVPKSYLMSQTMAIYCFLSNTPTQWTKRALQHH